MMMKDPSGVSSCPEFRRGIYLLQQRTVWTLGQRTVIKMDGLCKENVRFQHSLLSSRFWFAFLVFFPVAIMKTEGFGSPLLMGSLRGSFRFATCADRSCTLWSLKVSGEEDVCLFILQFPPGLWMNNRPAPETGPHPPQEAASHWPASRPNVFTVHTSARTESSCSSVACLETRSELQSFIPRGLLKLMFESRAGIFCFLLPFTEKRRRKKKGS